MTSIFISYAAQDESFVRDLADLLSSNHSVLYSEASLAAGQNWQQALNQSLREVDAVVIIISGQSYQSRLLMAEIGAVVGYWQEKGRPLIVPVLIEEVEIPAPLMPIQAIYAPERDLKQIVVKITSALDSFSGRMQAREEKRQEVQERVEKKSEEYISQSLEELRNRERSYRRTAYFWYSFALLSLLIGLGFGLWRAVSAEQASWEGIVEAAVVSLIVIGLLGALSRFAYILGKSFMVESLRNSDRIHAISFGQFYLQAFGEDAEWSEIKEAFQHWNIDKGSSFIEQKMQDIDPEILKIAVELGKTLVGKSK